MAWVGHGTGSEVKLAIVRSKEAQASLDRACGAKYLTLCMVEVDTGSGMESRIIAQYIDRGQIMAQVSWSPDATDLAERVRDVLAYGIRHRQAEHIQR